MPSNQKRHWTSIESWIQTTSLSLRNALTDNVYLHLIHFHNKLRGSIQAPSSGNTTSYEKHLVLCWFSLFKRKTHTTAVNRRTAKTLTHTLSHHLNITRYYQFQDFRSTNIKMNFQFQLVISSRNGRLLVLRLRWF